MKKIVYLAHSVHERSKGKRIKSLVEATGNYQVYNPFYPVDARLFRGDIKALDEGRLQPWKIYDEKRSEWIVETDLKAVARSDLVICVFPKRRTVGVSCEMMYAWLLRIPVYSLVPVDMVGHPWIVYLSKRIFTKLEELLSFLRENDSNLKELIEE